MHWTVHIKGGPRRVNHAAVSVGHCIYSFGGYCTGENYSIVRPIDVYVLNPGKENMGNFPCIATTTFFLEFTTSLLIVVLLFYASDQFDIECMSHFM